MLFGQFAQDQSILNIFPSYTQVDEEGFNEEKNFVARLMHMLHNDGPDKMLKATISVFIVKFNCTVVSSIIFSFIIIVICK